MFKPHLACDADLTKLKLPLILMPKIDGVRGLNVEGRFVGRSLKQHGNKFVSNHFSGDMYNGFDGELASLEINHPDLCRITTGDVNRHEGEPDVHFWVFDLVSEDFAEQAYGYRLGVLASLVAELDNPRIHCVPYHMVNSLEEVLELEEFYLIEGFEGIILRDPYGVHKNGRSTARSNGFLRLKRFVEEDATVLGVIEGNVNNNEAKKNELGRTERSSHQENLTPNGMVGALPCRCHATGKEVLVSAGSLDHEQRKYYFENQDQIIGKVIKYKSFPKGVKDKPRFPTFHSFRADSDLVG